MNTQNPTQKAQSEPEPAWIRDNNAADQGGGVVFFAEASFDEIGAACESEIVCCVFCGEKCALWPISVISKHILDHHRDELTLQAQQMFTAQLMPGLTAGTAAVMHQHIMTRVSLRRRAWQLGMAKAVDASQVPGVSRGPRIHLPGRSQN